MVLIISCLICLFVPCGPLLMWLPFVCDCCWQQQYSQIQYSGAAMTTTVIATQPVMAVQAQPAGQVVYAQAVPAAGVYPASALPSAHEPAAMPTRENSPSWTLPDAFVDSPCNTT